MVAPHIKGAQRAAAARVELVEATPSVVQPVWAALEPLARPSYFLTWGWVETWLDMLPRADRPLFAVLRDGDRPRATFFLGRRRMLRHGFVSSRSLHLNATGSARRDAVCIEHNGILTDGAWSVGDLVAALPDDWDELFLPGIDAIHAEDPLPHGLERRLLRDVACPIVELERVRSQGYLPLLSANTRQQIKRARRRLGETTLDVATHLAQATAVFDQLIDLHGRSWKARGQAGAFADRWFLDLHRALIARRFAHGEILLARLRSGAATVGCVYGLVSYGRVLFYQSGLASYADAAIKPGLLAHAALVEHAAAAGHTTYDFLGGDSRYKASLATDIERLVWMCVRRDLRRFSFEDRLRRWKRRLAGVRP
ncbi:MAG: GNAT family N-acetyltransferase [Kofleriaceae bacterium]